MKAAGRGLSSLVEDTGETDFDTFRDAWWGEADSEEAFAVEFASDTGLLADVPETVALYFDYEAYARDLFLDSFTFIDGHVSVGDFSRSGGGMACQAPGKPWQAYACLKYRRAAPAALPFLPVIV